MDTTNYTFKFKFHEPETISEEVYFEFDSYEKALEEAKFYFDVFFSVIWYRKIKNQNTKNTFKNVLDETMKVASNFDLSPNLSNFNFYEYAKSRYTYYRFEQSLNCLRLR